MINAHPMVVGSFASNPSSVRVRKYEQIKNNAGFAASEYIMDKKYAALGSAKLAIALHRAFAQKSTTDAERQDNLDCIAIHEATIARLTKRIR